MRILRGSIDVSKIDKSKLVNGKKGTYMNVSIFIRDDVDQYGNTGFITQDTTKEERIQGIKGTILGNIKDLPGRSPAPVQHYSDELSNKITPPVVNLADDLPF
jgi:hypothetical protein